MKPSLTASTGGRALPVPKRTSGSAPPYSSASRRYDDPGVLARVVALKMATTAELKQHWRDLFTTEPPPYNRKYLESRLAYRIQELEYGGLKSETLKRLAALADDLESGKLASAHRRTESRPIAGTRLVREWQGAEHCVTVAADGYEWQGRPYQSLSAVARAITGTRWNGWTFFGLKNHRAEARGRG